MAKQLMQQALDALRQCEFTSPPAQRPIVKDAITALRSALDASPATSADYAMGYAEGFNDACKPAPVVPAALVEAVAKAIYWEWRRDAGYVPWVDGGNSFKQDDARKIARAVVSGAAPVVREPLTDEQINDIWNAKYLPEHRSHLSPWGMDRIRAIIAAANGIGGGGND